MKKSILFLLVLEYIIIYGFPPTYKHIHGPIYKKDLRNMYEIEKTNYILNLIDVDYKRIDFYMLEEAIQGNNEYKFNIYCRYKLKLDGNCILQNEELLLRNRKMTYKMPFKFYTENLIKKLNETFPDSTITNINYPCCDYDISF